MNVYLDAYACGGTTGHEFLRDFVFDTYAAVVFVRVRRYATRVSLSSSDASLKAALPKRVDSYMKVS